MGWRTMTVSWKGKLLLSFALLALAFLGVAGFNQQQVRGIEEQFDHQMAKTEQQLLARDLLVMTQELKDISSGLMISRDLTYVDTYNKKRAEFEALISRIGNTAETDEQRAWRSELVMARTNFLELFDRAVSLMQNKSLTDRDIQKNTDSLYRETQQERDRVFELVSRFDADFSRAANAAAAASRSSLAHTTAVMAVASLLVLLLTLAVSAYLLQAFLRPVRRLQRAAAVLAEGDFRQPIGSTSRDEFGQLSREFDRMMAQVRTMLQGTHGIASSLSERSGRFRHFAQVTASANASIVRALEEISTGADQQAAQTEQSAQLVAELADEVAGISGHAEHVHALSREASGNTRTGSQAVLQLQAASGRSEELLGAAAAAMERFVADSEQIGRIVRTIRDIATETNVLAVNAAIEAARAGQHGRGFSVIAGQVRQLADETASSAGSITQLIGALQEQTHEVRQQMHSVQDAAAVQSGKLADTLQSFRSIEASIEQLHGRLELIREQTHAAKTRNAGFAETLTLVAAIAEETAAGVQEVNSTSVEQHEAIQQIAAQSDDIHELAQQLFEGMSRFKTEVDG